MLESPACIEEATAVCTECETMDVGAANPVELLAAVVLNVLVGTRAAEEAGGEVDVCTCRPHSETVEQNFV